MLSHQLACRWGQKGEGEAGEWLELAVVEAGAECRFADQFSTRTR